MALDGKGLKITSSSGRRRLRGRDFFMTRIATRVVYPDRFVRLVSSILPLSAIFSDNLSKSRHGT
jgi:hypothetical protein